MLETKQNLAILIKKLYFNLDKNLKIFLYNYNSLFYIILTNFK